MSWQDIQDPNRRAALISGPPGIGKTSAARIVCAQLGYEVIEKNASDTRNKAAIENQIHDLSLNKSLNYFSVAGIKKAEQSNNPLASAIGGLATQKSVIIMDEVDGVGAGDRGGIAALIKVIKTSKTPIICICNDRASQKIQSLANYCYDLKFQRPPVEQIRKMIQKVATKEGVPTNDQMVTNMIESSGNDIRQIINILQMWSQHSGKGMEEKGNADNSTASQQVEKQASDFLKAVSKDEKVMINNFEAAYRLLNHGQTSLDKRYKRFRDKLDLFFIDHEWVPLLVQDSYLNVMSAGTESGNIEAMADASEFISMGDCLNRQIRVNQNWSLLPNAGICSSVAPALIVKGKSTYPRFPEWLGKNSSQRKSLRQIRELKLAMGQAA